MRKRFKKRVFEASDWNTGSAILSDSPCDVSGIISSGSGTGTISLVDGSTTIATITEPAVLTEFKTPIPTANQLRVLYTGTGGYAVIYRTKGPKILSTGTLKTLREYGGLTFFKDYGSLPTGEVTATQLNADLAVGSAVATFTADYTSKTSSWIDDNGVIHQHSGTNNVARVNGGYWDETGFHQYDANSKRMKGLMVEAAGTNIALNSYFSLDSNSNGLADNWDGGWFWHNTPTFSLVSASSISAISGHQWQREQYTVSASDNGWEGHLNYKTPSSSVANGDTVTFSFLYTLTGTIDHPLYVGPEFMDSTDSNEYNQAWTALSTTSTPIKFTKTITASNASVSKARIVFGFNGTNPTAGTTFDLKITDIQVEKSPYATSFIPTTTDALSRPAESLSYLTAGNRTAASESMFMAFSPEHSGTGTSNYRSGYMALYDTDTKRRKNSCWPVANGGKMRYDSNATDSDSADIANSTTQPAINIRYVVAVTSQHSNPYATISVNGVNEGSNTTIDWVDPAWGTKFWIGSSNDTGSQLGGIISSVAIYSDAKTATPVSQISSILGAL